MYNSCSGPTYPPINNHHKAHAGGLDVDCLPLPLPVTAGTSCVDSPSTTSYAHFQNTTAVGAMGGMIDFSSSSDDPDVTSVSTFVDSVAGHSDHFTDSDACAGPEASVTDFWLLLVPILLS